MALAWGPLTLSPCLRVGPLHRVQSFRSIVFTTGCGAISPPASGVPPLSPSSLTPADALTYSHSSLQLQLLLCKSFSLLLNSVTQRHHHHGWRAWPWAAVGLFRSQLALAPSDMREASHRGHPYSLPLSKPGHENPKHTGRLQAVYLPSRPMLYTDYGFQVQLHSAILISVAKS